MPPARHASLFRTSSGDMDSSYGPLVIPRLRLSRTRSPQFGDGGLTPVAGPSRGSFSGRFADSVNDTDNGSDYEDDDSRLEATPRLPPLDPLPGSEPTTDPAAQRLRDLLRRTEVRKSPSPPPVTASDRESDLDTPSLHSPITPARQSLRALMEHALREPGDTPQKRPRRRSFDESEMEDSPQLQREDKLHYKGKRKSLSDEEAEARSQHSSGYHRATDSKTPLGPHAIHQRADTHRSESSFGSGRASKYDSLRARVDLMSEVRNQQPPTHLYDTDSTPIASSADVAS